jgi:hypothetical protein
MTYSAFLWVLTWVFYTTHPEWIQRGTFAFLV